MEKAEEVNKLAVSSSNRALILSCQQPQSQDIGKNLERQTRDAVSKFERVVSLLNNCPGHARFRKASSLSHLPQDCTSMFLETPHSRPESELKSLDLLDGSLDINSFHMELSGLPAGMKFDPTDQELVQHLEAKVVALHKLHPIIDEFIPTLEDENGICYTHPEKLPGVSRDGLICHFFHRLSKAYATGTRKRRKVSMDKEGGETRWHKTGKTRLVFINGEVKGFKKILVLYTHCRPRKPEKTNWVMHQYHIGSNEEEKDGELVVSKVFYQTKPRQCDDSVVNNINHSLMIETKD